MIHSPGHATLSETELLARVRRPVPADLQRRYSQLTVRLEAEILTPEEHQELLRLTDQVEQLNVERIEHIAALARMRGVSLRYLMDDLGLGPSEHG